MQECIYIWWYILWNDNKSNNTFQLFSNVSKNVSIEFWYMYWIMIEGNYHCVYVLSPDTKSKDNEFSTDWCLGIKNFYWSSPLKVYLKFKQKCLFLKKSIR